MMARSMARAQGIARRARGTRQLPSIAQVGKDPFSPHFAFCCTSRGIHQAITKKGIKDVLKNYGKPALALHAGVYTTTLVSCYLALRAGVDMAPVVDMTKDYLPTWLVNQTKPAAESSQLGVAWLKDWVNAETISRAILAWSTCAATGPIRGVITVVGAPILARHMNAPAAIAADVAAHAPGQLEQPRASRDPNAGLAFTTPTPARSSSDHHGDRHDHDYSVDNSGEGTKAVRQRM